MALFNGGRAMGGIAEANAVLTQQNFRVVTSPVAILSWDYHVALCKIGDPGA